jgi:hypothetical protein
VRDEESYQHAADADELRLRQDVAGKAGPETYKEKDGTDEKHGKNSFRLYGYYVADGEDNKDDG